MAGERQRGSRDRGRRTARRSHHRHLAADHQRVLSPCEQAARRRRSVAPLRLATSARRARPGVARRARRANEGGRGGSKPRVRRACAERPADRRLGAVAPAARHRRSASRRRRDLPARPPCGGGPRADPAGRLALDLLSLHCAPIRALCRESVRKGCRSIPRTLHQIAWAHGKDGSRNSSSIRRIGASVSALFPFDS